MSKWYKPRFNYKADGESVKYVYTVEYDGYPETNVTVEFHFIIKKEAEEFYKENNESDIATVDKDMVSNED